MAMSDSDDDDDNDSDDDKDDASISKGDRVEAKLKGWTKYYKGKITKKIVMVHLIYCLMMANENQK